MLLFSPPDHYARHFFQHIIELEIGLLQHQLARLDTGEIQQVVDHSQQQLGGIKDLLQVILLVAI